MKANQEKCHLLASLGKRSKFSLLACILKKLRLSKTSRYDKAICVIRQAKTFKHLQEFFHIYPKHKNDY